VLLCYVYTWLPVVFTHAGLAYMPNFSHLYRISIIMEWSHFVLREDIVCLVTGSIHTT